MLIGDDEKDARAFRDGVGAIEALLEADLPLQTQHYRRPRKGTAACGAAGQTVTSPLGVTCAACKRYLARKDER